MLCDRLSLSHKMLKGTERYKDMQNIVNTAVKKLKKEVGPLDKVSAVMARGIVNRLNCGAEVQKLCASAVEAADSMFSSSTDYLADTEIKAPGNFFSPDLEILPNKIRHRGIELHTSTILSQYRYTVRYDTARHTEC